MKRGLLILLFLPIVNASLITVTPADSDTDAYTKIESAQAGDIVEIAPGTYKFRVNLVNDGTSTNPIIIRAQNPSDRPVWDLSGKHIEDWPGSYTAGDRGRGAWQIRGSHYIISDLVIRGAKYTRGSLIGESSGIRPTSAGDVIVRNCLIEDNDNGIVGRASHILYEFCEIRNNGVDRNQFPNADGTHNVYNHGGNITIRYSYIHDPADRQNFHIRAENGLLEYNLIENGKNYMGDIMTNTYDRNNGDPMTQTLTLLGNLIIEAPNPTNDGQVFVTYNDQEWPQTTFVFNMFYNTFVGNGKTAALFHITDKPGTVMQEVNLNNNIFYGNTKPFRIDISSGFQLDVNNNWWQNADYSQWSAYMSNSILGTDPGFKDPGSKDYSLKSSAQSKGAANPSLSITPSKEYYQDLRYRFRDDNQDLGALESTTTGIPIGYNTSSGVCSPLPLTGPTVTVSTATELRNAISSAVPGTTILIEDGTYNVRDIVLSTDNVTLRSVSGDREKVILDGNYQGGSVINVRTSHITITDLTIKRAWYHPVHVGGGGHYLRLYNLHIIDGKEQFVKVNPSGGKYNDYGELACSTLEMTDAGRSYLQQNPTPGFLCYTGGLDAHQTLDWHVHDNIIKDIYCTNGGLAEHGIHFWRTNKDSVVERNIVINCARGIGFGLANDGKTARIYPDFNHGDFTGSVDHIKGVIRNNMVIGDVPGNPGFDGGIILWNSYGSEVYHNTVFSNTGQGSTIETRFSNTKDCIIKNNLIWKAPWFRSGSPGVVSDNVETASASMFVDSYNDLHLVDTASVIDQGTQVGGIVDDVDGNYRDSQPDIGADEYGDNYQPPPCVPAAEICGNGIDEDCVGGDLVCTCGAADTDKNNKVAISEISSFINSWKSGSVSIPDLMKAIDEWKNGC